MQHQDFSWMIPIEVMLNSLNRGEVQASSISRVADKLRDSKEEAYEPKLFSIGLLHGGSSTRQQPQLMEDPKWHYMKDFLDRKGTTQEQTKRSELRLRECGSDLLKLQKVIRASYRGNIESEPDEVAKIIVVDGCFLLEILIRLGNYMEGNQSSYCDDPIFVTEENVLLVLNDITMLENQIPFIALKKLYRKVFPDGSEIKNDHRVADIVRKAFGYPLTNSSGGAHILNIMHMSTVEQSPQLQQNKRAKQELLRCANMLLATGVILRSKPNTQKQHMLVDKFDFDIKFDKGRGELEIPTLYVKETTEVKWRNLIAWEQSKIWIQCKYTSYALFFKGLICCKHDIELLIEKGIIVNYTKMNNEDLLRLFGTISVGAKDMDSSFSEICDDLNEYKRNIVTRVFRQVPLVAWHQCRRVIDMVVYIWRKCLWMLTRGHLLRNWYRALITDHIPTVWKFIGVMAAALLLVLTMMQTYYASKSIKQ